MSLLAYSPEVVFSGEVDQVSVRGLVARARCLPGGRAMERLLPRMRLQPGCNHVLFSVGCGLAVEDWQFNAVVTDAGAPAWPFEFVLGGLTRANGSGLPAFTPDWFAGGWIRFGIGGAARSVPVVRSSAVSGGSVTLTLTRDPAPFPVAGLAVSVWPGCDGMAGTCQEKFSNWLNFGGHPFRPIANPSLVKLSSAVVGGKK